ncbi:chemotaxis protein CheY [Pseudomonas fluorescens]|uniref:chemotaxis protein CheY n=1 Tax=Pseudomonas TaxID=286 RepID=UPI003D022360
MSNKALRILIADGQHFQRIKIEKMLNQLGYCRIAPLSSFQEVQSVTRTQGHPFDLLIINTALVLSTEFNLLKYCHENPRIRHALIYEGWRTECSMVSVSVSQAIQVCLSKTPDFDSLKRCMDVVDPASRNSSLERTSGLLTAI